MEIEGNEKITCFANAFKAVTALEYYATQIENIPILETILNVLVRTLMEKNAPHLMKKQKTLHDFWK
jgi:hypothetical protein